MSTVVITNRVPEHIKVNADYEPIVPNKWYWYASDRHSQPIGAGAYGPFDTAADAAANMSTVDPKWFEEDEYALSYRADGYLIWHSKSGMNRYNSLRTAASIERAMRHAHATEIEWCSWMDTDIRS